MGHLDDLFQGKHSKETELKSDYNRKLNLYKSAIESFYKQIEDWLKVSISKGTIKIKRESDYLIENDNSNEIIEMYIEYGEQLISLKPIGINVHDGFEESGDILGGLRLMSIHNINGPTTNLYFKTPENKWYQSNKELIDELKFTNLIKLVLS